MASSTPDTHKMLVSTDDRPRILHLGDPICFNPSTYEALSCQYHVIMSRNSCDREIKQEALKNGTWGNFEAIFRPHWATGGEMGAWDAELIDLLPPRMKVFASAGAGFDWVDTEHLGKRGILYCNGGAASADAVADFAAALIISTFRLLPWCMSAAMSTSVAAFRKCHLEAPAQAYNLRGKVLGIIGLGNIDHRIALHCHQGFGMNIHYYDIKRKSDSLEQPAKAIFHDTLEGLLRVSDCMVLCIPASPGATSIINASALAQMRHGSRLVNVARGVLIDENALLVALEEGRLSAVALDVHATEPHPHEGLRRFVEAGRVMLTCHNAGGTVETHSAFEELSMRNVMAVLSGGQAISAVNVEYLRSGAK